MKLETYTLNVIITILCSVGFGSILTIVANRKKTKAETEFAQSQTKLTDIEVYSTMLGDLRNQINMQGDQIKNQASQILALQTKESEYLKIINAHQRREKDLLKRVKELEDKITELQNLS
jgi:vacuolar-type H+-ATPase subunit I/STV1